MNFLGLIQKAQATGADTLASPTFPYTPPGTPVNNNTNPTTGRNIILQSDTTSVKVQEEFKVRIYLDTKTSSIQSFSVNISFDPSYFQVVDSDSATDGVQIDYLDSTFSAKTNTANNSTGVISVRAEVESSAQATTITRSVAEITFLPIKKGSSKITVVESNSNLSNTSGVDILDNTNSLTFSIDTQAIQPVTPSGGDTNNPDIPKTGFLDSASLITASIGGILLIATGIYIVRISKINNRGKNHSR